MIAGGALRGAATSWMGYDGWFWGGTTGMHWATNIVYDTGFDVRQLDPLDGLHQALAGRHDARGAGRDRRLGRRPLHQERAHLGAGGRAVRGRTLSGPARLDRPPGQAQPARRQPDLRRRSRRLPRPDHRSHAPRMRERVRRRRRQLRRLAGRSRLRFRARSHGAAGPGRRTASAIPRTTAWWSSTPISTTPISTATETSATATSTTTGWWEASISPLFKISFQTALGHPVYDSRPRSGRG